MDKERRRRRNSSPSPIGAGGEQARGGLSPFSQRMQKQQAQAQNPSMMNMPPEYGHKKPEPGANADAPLPPGEVSHKM